MPFPKSRCTHGESIRPARLSLSISVGVAKRLLHRASVHHKFQAFLDGDRLMERSIAKWASEVASHVDVSVSFAITRLFQ